jgi:hypothetical protein
MELFGKGYKMAYIFKKGKVVRKEMPLISQKDLEKIENLPKNTYLDKLGKKIKKPKIIMK